MLKRIQKSGARMNVIEPTAHSAAEDPSDRSNSSSSESQLHAFQEYGKIRELNLSTNKAKDPIGGSKLTNFSFALDGGRQHGFSFGVLATERLAKDHQDKGKEFDFQQDNIKDMPNYSVDKSEDPDGSRDTTKEYISNLQNRPEDGKVAVLSFDVIDAMRKEAHFPREARDNRKNIHFPGDRSKDLNFQKTYNHPLDRIKDFNFALDRRRESHVGGLALERLRGGSFLEPADYRNAQIQPRDDLEAIAIERMRRSQILTTDIVPRNLSAHLQLQPLSITEMQHSQQQQQQQGKSFTIDSILGLRNNQRDKQQRSQQHPYRKNQGQEISAKNSSSGSSVVSSGKLKRVRTIFTAEQLERLEREFARQQYMVGPERLYLAHELRLTEAQVKVWFQNRRIKWRKLNHEQQSLRIHELHSLEPDVEDSNEKGDCQDVVNEHTEPSPVPSATMDQADLEAQSQTRKLRRGRHSSSSYWPNWASRLPTDGTTASADSYWKVGPRPAHSVSHNHEQRKHDYGVTEPVTSCYSASNTYRPRPRTLSSASSKPQHVVPSPDQTYRASQQGSRTARNKLLTTNNVAVVRKSCYKEDPEEEEDDVKYAEEEINYAEENVDDEVAEEVDEDQEETFEYNEKDYEELQEADDEVDDESDAFQTQLHRAQNKVQKASNHRVHNMRHPEQQQELRRTQRPQNPLKMYQDQKLSSSRFYSHGPDLHRETSYGDAAEVINSEEEHTPPQTPPRRSSRRMSETHQAVPNWIPARKSFERNRERLSAAPLVNSQHHQRQQRLPHHQNLEQQQQQQQHHHQQPRRSHRTAKPEIESLMMPQPSTPGTKKCCICGGSTAPVTMRVGSPKKGSCRLHEYRGLSVKGPRGEDGEAEEQVVCPRCVKRHNMEDLRSGCDATSSPEAVPLYPGKPHRPKVHRPSTYECPDENLTVDEMLATYASNGQTRASGLDYSTNAPRERTRHSVQTARSPLRRGSYYER